MKIIKAIMSVPLKLSLYIMGSIIYVLATASKLLSYTISIIKILIILSCILMSIAIFILFISDDLDGPSLLIIVVFYIISAIVYSLIDFLNIIPGKFKNLSNKIYRLASFKKLKRSNYYVDKINNRNYTTSQISNIQPINSINTNIDISDNQIQSSPDFPKNAIVIHINKINKGYSLFEVSILNTDLIILFDQEVNLQKLYNHNIISEELMKIQEIINRSSEIIGYNIKYQLKLLEKSGLLVPAHIVINDIMEDFSILYGDYNPAYGRFNNKTLAECAKYFQYDWNFNREFSNNVLYCEAILYFYIKLADMKDIINFNKKMKKQY